MLNISLTWTGREAARQMALRARTLDSPVKGLAGLASHLRRAAEEAPPGCPGATRYWLDAPPGDDDPLEWSALGASVCTYTRCAMRLPSALTCIQ